jgi:uncharacterized repeat protein (TIGR01451 family)
MKKSVLAVSAISLMLVASTLQAKKSPVTLSTKSYKEVSKVDANGNKKIVLVEAKKVVPGDYVVYKNNVKNSSDKSVKGMVLNNPIPEHTQYIAKSAKCKDGCEILFSVDGGKKFATPEKLMIKVGNVERLALAKEYTNVRWVLTSSLNAKSSTEVSFKTRLQ